MVRVLFSIVLGVVLSVVGAALAVNYRGIATKHVEMSMSFVGPVSPFRGGRSGTQLERRRDFFVLLDRIIGLLLALFGAGSMVAGGYLLVT